MPRLRVIIGPAGSGKTRRVLDEAASAALTSPLPSIEHPPLLIIVPEQQAVLTERQLLARINQVAGRRVAVARTHVMSLTRLALVLAERAGMRLEVLGDLGRRLLVWRHTEEGADRKAKANVIAELLAELSINGARAADLESLAGGFTAGNDPLKNKLLELARTYRSFERSCESREINHLAAPGFVPELLAAGHWPLLEATRVWVDGFKGFTPPEEHALSAILERCAGLSATILLDPARESGPEPGDYADWYAPTRDLLSCWKRIAGSLAATIEIERIKHLERWPAGHPLGGTFGAAAGILEPARGSQANGGGFARAVVCADERAEIDGAARQILDLVSSRCYRFADISVVARSLLQYADLIEGRFADHGIPFFIDRREPLSRHPAVELVRCGLRLALGSADAEDVLELLKTELLPGAEDAIEYRRRIDLLENHARRFGLMPWHWIDPRTWVRRSTETDDEKLQQELDGWRLQILAPVISLKQAIGGLERLTAGDVLTLAWEHLLGPVVAERLENWAQAVEGVQPRLAQAHRGVLQLIAAVIDELSSLGAEESLSAAELCGWLEYGLGELSLGCPPPVLDAVLVTEIERGRHHAVKATLLVGLAEDSWPPPAAERPFFTDEERSAVNGGGSRLLAGGAMEKAAQEPYFALVAATRPSEFIYLSRPGADSDGRARQLSPYYAVLLKTLGLVEEIAGSTCLAEPWDAGTVADLVVLNARHPAGGQLGEVIKELIPKADSRHCGWAAQAGAALAWSLAESSSSGELPPLPAADIDRLTSGKLGHRLLRLSATRLECFAACPFKHYAKYLLQLRDREELTFDALMLGGFYHRVLEQTVSRLNARGFDWIAGDAGAVREKSDAVLAEMREEMLESSGRKRADYLVQRAGVLLDNLSGEMSERLAASGRVPVMTELRFGSEPGADLPPVVIETDRGMLEIGGFIDRVDLSKGGRVTVVDYKLGERKTDWARFLAGEQLQLFIYLLALENRDLALKPPTAGSARSGKLTPYLAEYQRIEPGWKAGSADFEPAAVPPAGTRGSAEAQRQVSEQLLQAALVQTRRMIAEIGLRIFDGEIAPRPLRKPGGREWRACTHCDYRAVCRFDPAAGHRYRDTEPLPDAALRDAIAAGEKFELSTGSAADESPGGGGGGGGE